MFAAQNGMSEAGWLIIVGFGLILCLAVFTIAVVFLAYRLTATPESDNEMEFDEMEKRLASLESDSKTIRDALKRNGILKSPRDIPSPPPLNISRGSA